MVEEWKPVPGFEGKYEVSSFGRFKSLERDLIYSDGRKGRLKESLIKGSLGNAGYLIISLDTKHKQLAHRIVARAFLGEPEYRTTVNHKDGNKTNNRVDNLEWATYQQNNIHARKTGLNKQHGENTNLSKHSDRFIQAVRNVHNKYNPTYVELGELFGISDYHARQIVLFLTRKTQTG